MTAPADTAVTLVLACPDEADIALDVHRPAARERTLPVTVVCHGFKGFRRWGMFPSLSERLAAGGRAVVSLDFSHNGTAPDDPETFCRLDRFRTQTPSRHVADLRVVIDELDARADALELDLAGGVSVVGHSMGGGVALLAAADDGRIARVATLNGVSHFQRVSAAALDELERRGVVSIPNARTGQTMELGRAWFDDIERLDLEGAARRVDRPVLVVAGTGDPTVPFAEAEALVSWLPQGRLATVEGGDHTFGARHPWSGWTDPLRQVAALLDDFLPAV